MSDNNICLFQEEHIKQLATHETKIEKLEDDISCLNRIDKSIEKLSLLMEIQVKDNDKRDNLLNKMSESLDNLNSEIKNTNKRIDRLENKFEKSESKNLIDIREIEKEKVKKSLFQKTKKFAIPAGIVTLISGFVGGVFELLKTFKIIK